MSKQIVKIEVPFVANLIMWGYLIKNVVYYTFAAVVVVLAIALAAGFLYVVACPSEHKPQFVRDIEQRAKQIHINSAQQIPMELPQNPFPPELPRPNGKPIN